MGALQAQDIPLSAIDFHVSSITDWLLQHSTVGPAARQAGEACSFEPETAIKKVHTSLLQRLGGQPWQLTERASGAQAMWRCSSSLNTKRQLEPQVTCCLLCTNMCLLHACSRAAACCA